MTRMRVAIAVLFLVAFAAGGSLSLALRPRLAPVPKHEDSMLARELDLTPRQQEQMKAIWAEMGRDGNHDEGDRRRALQSERDEAIRALVPAEQQAELDAVLQNYSRQMAEISAQRRKAFEVAVGKTKTILTPEQQRKYEAFLSRRSEGRRSGRGPGAATAPAATQPGAASPEQPATGLP